MMNLLLLGPVTNSENGLIGGATISFGYLKEYFLKSEPSTMIINTKRYFGRLSGLRNIIHIFFRLCQCAPKSDVIFLNSSRGGTKYLAPLVFLMSKIFAAKFIFRPFGGDIKDYTEHYNAFSNFVFKKTVLKSDIFYLQTKALVGYYKLQNANVLQLPTSRRKPQIETLEKSKLYSKRFIYLGFINEAKGIQHILDAAAELGDDYTVHIYGPIKDQRFTSLPDHIYKGVLRKEEVMTTLATYDVLLLPTFYEGEGYPGAIIESYSLGIPVITTKWKSIPEIVEDGKSGILINPHSTEELIEAMRNIDLNNYKVYSANALRYFNDIFNEEKVLGKVAKEIQDLINK